MKLQIVFRGSIALLALYSLHAKSAKETSQSTQVTGQIKGQVFKPTLIEIRQLGRASVRNASKTEYAEAFHLEFRNGKGFFADNSILIMLQLPSGSKLSNLKWTQKEVKFASPEYDKQFFPSGNTLAHGAIGCRYSYKKAGKDMPHTEMSNTLGMSIIFGTQVKDRIAGAIYMTADGGKAVLKGTFTAVVKKV